MAATKRETMSAAITRTSTGVQGTRVTVCSELTVSSYAWLARQRFEARSEVADRRAFLLRRVALPDRHRLVVQSVEVDGDAEGGADLVLAAVATADVAARLVVLHAEMAPQRLNEILCDSDQFLLLR